MLSQTQIKRMSREEKLRTMEAIWTDLANDDSALASPAWHEDALKETEARVASGQEHIEDWHEAKRELRKHFE
jgi:hypothetical protein